MTSIKQNIIHQVNCVISLETLPEYPHPVVIKKPSERHPFRRSLRSLEREYDITSFFHRLRLFNACNACKKLTGHC